MWHLSSRLWEDLFFFFFIPLIVLIGMETTLKTPVGALSWCIKHTVIDYRWHARISLDSHLRHPQPKSNSKPPAVIETLVSDIRACKVNCRWRSSCSGLNASLNWAFGSFIKGAHLSIFEYDDIKVMKAHYLSQRIFLSQSKRRWFVHQGHPWSSSNSPNQPYQICRESCASAHS